MSATDLLLRFGDADFLPAMEKRKSFYEPNRFTNSAFVTQAEPALMYDSVMVFALGLASFLQSSELGTTNVSCDTAKPWVHGSSLFNYINAVSHNFLLYARR